MNAATAAAIAAAAAGALFSPSAGAEILSAKRGFADTGANYSNLQATGAGWYYTWGTGVGNPGNFDANHYPMFWSAPSQTTINTVKTRNPQYVLGFNEPERPDQANMSVAQAISSWTGISNSFTGTSTKLVSPAVADTGGTDGGQAWLREFMRQATASNLKVDAVAFHWYGVSNPNNPSGAASSFLSRVDSYWNEYRKPVFITEFAIHDWGGAYSDEAITEANRQFLNIVIPALESRSHVAGYSWYHWFSDARLYAGNPPTPTPMAYSYVGAVGAGQVQDVGGENLGEHVAYLTGGELTMTGATPGTVRYINALANTSNISGSVDWSPASWVRIQPGATLRKTGANRITFGAGSVTNDGVLEVAQGVVRLGGSVQGTGSIHISSTGSTTGSTARLELSGKDITLAQPITFAQRNDPGGSDGIRNVSGSNALTGRITIAVGGNQARIQSDAGQLTLTGGITTNAASARNLYLQGAGTGLVSGVISNNASNAAGSINVYKEGAGTWTLTGANTYTGATTVNAGTLRVSRLHQASAVAVNGGKLQVMDSSPTLPLHPAGDNASVSRPSAMTIANDGAALGARTYNGQLDLGNNDLILDYADPAASPLAAIQDMVRAGFNGGNWLGNGLTSSTANVNRNFALAVADNSKLVIPFGDGTTGRLFSGQVVDSTTILVKFTHRIDLDLDGVVTSNDASIFNSRFNEGAPAYWSIGDVDYDGVFTSNDASIFNSFYNEALASVPEPASAAVLIVAAACLRPARRRSARARGS
jgi:autotransporter-associated beta strand protein